MKFCCYLLFTFLIGLHVQGQNCPKLDAQSFFSSIRFGEKIPLAFAVCANQPDKAIAANYSLLRIEYDSLQQGCKKKYKDLFHFLSQPFSFSQISTNTKGQILSVELYSFFKEYNATDPSSSSPIPAFVRLYKKLESLYGKPTMQQLPTKIDSVLMRERGMEQSAVWACSTIDLTLRVYYGAPQKGLNILHVNIRNRDFDRPEVEETLHNK